MAPAESLEVVRMALATLRRSPMRSALTILGLSIGVGAFIAMTSFGQGARRSVVGRFAELGTNLVKVDTLYREAAPGPDPARPLTADDLRYLRRDLTSASHIVPSSRARVPARARGRMIATSLVGTTTDYFTIHGWVASDGGFFDATDEMQRNKTCVVGRTVAQALFEDSRAVGTELSLGDALSCTIVGILASKGMSTSGRDLDDLVVVPVSTYEAYIGLPDGYATIEVEARSAALVGTLRDEVRQVLLRAHEIDEGGAPDFRVTSPTEAIRAADKVSTILANLLAIIAAISLVVGGIGIMNIQLVAVAERTREIGIRSALGASPSQILSQFLAESIVLSSIGAGLGIAIGVGSSFIVAESMHWSNAVDRRGVLIAAVFGIGAGVVFGYVPARRASELEPVDALRHE